MSKVIILLITGLSFNAHCAEMCHNNKTIYLNKWQTWVHHEHPTDYPGKCNNEIGLYQNNYCIDFINEHTNITYNINKLNGILLISCFGDKNYDVNK